MYNNYLAIENQLEEMKREDYNRIRERKNKPNLYKRNKNRRYKDKKLYNKTNKSNKYTGSGIYYKKNDETEDFFLSRYYNSNNKKKTQKISNKKLRKDFNNNFSLKGAGYKKVYDSWNNY